MENSIKVSFEIKAPLISEKFDDYLASLKILLQWKPQFFSIANHQPDSKYFIINKSYLIKKGIDKNANPFLFAIYLQQKTQIKVIPHLVANEIEINDIDNVLLSLYNFGIDTFMVLRGDRSDSDIRYINKYSYSSDILRHTKQLNKKYNKNIKVGVAAYPDSHPQTKCRKTEIHFLKQKVLKGATFITTQMFFDNDKFYDCKKLFGSNEITVPVFPGLKLLDKIKNLDIYSYRFNVSIPTELKNRFVESEEQNHFLVGRQWLYEQCNCLIQNGFDHLHFYIFSNEDTAAVDWVLRKLKKG